MKRQVKEIVWRYFSSDPAKIKNIIRDFAVVSFDMFDTLVTRNVMDPTDIFSYVEILYHKKFGDIPFDFKGKRIEAEKKARQNVQREITLAEIYASLEALTGQNCSTFLELEKQCEFLFIEPRKDMRLVYEECIRQKKKIYILSDMYLSKETITALLHKCGYFDWTGLYVSSNIGATKRNGELYKLFLASEHLSPQTILHIGDSIKSDYLRSGQYHLKSILLENRRGTIFFDRKNSGELNEREWLGYTALQSFCNNQLRGINDFSYILGYSVLGPVLFGFSRWLNEIVQEEKPDCLAFMAREGMMLKKAYERMFPQSPVPVGYLRTSRRSVAYPELLGAETLSDLLHILPVKRNEDLNGLLELLRLNNNHVWKQLEKFGYTPYTSVANVSPDILGILKDAIHEKAMHQKEYLRGYLEQNNIYGNVLAADIGWRGTTLHYLSRFCSANMPEKNIQIKGCYVGVLEDNKQKSFSRDPKVGYWFDKAHKEEWGYIVSVSRMACELLFMPDEGSTTHYADKDGNIVPCMDPLEFSGSDICKIQVLQDAALDFIDAFQDSSIKEMIHITPQMTLASYFRFGIRPNKESLGFINTFHYTESGAIYSYKTKRFWTYLTKPHKLIKDFSNTAWKTGFMRECFYVDLPYYKFLVWLRRCDQIRSFHGMKN